MKTRQFKYIKLLVATIILFSLVITLAGCSRENQKNNTTTTIETTKTASFSPTTKKHIAVLYPFDEQQALSAVATVRNLETDEVFTDNTYDTDGNCFGFLLEKTGKYLITLSLNEEIIKEHTVEVNDENSFYLVRMQND